MINLFHLNDHIIDTSKYSNLLHDNIVTEFEDTIKDYVGAKYAVSFNSATSALFLTLLGKNITLKVPSMIPPVVLNAIITSGNKYTFTDNVDWVGDSYVLHQFSDYKIVDSAQKLMKNQFMDECDDDDLMVFSFYPTKPIGSCDGGMIVSNNYEKILHLKSLALNGMSYSHNNWERQIQFAGYKMYMNSIQAEMGLNNFNKYEEKLSSLNLIREIYNKELGYDNTSYHLYRIVVEDRSGFMSHMKDNGVSTGIHYEAAHLHPTYRIDGSKCPKSEQLSKQTVSIPFHEGLKISEIYHIINKIKEYYGKTVLT
jgi:dTDP-4-amino-4,6-dideoxygalactose transaminase